MAMSDREDQFDQAIDSREKRDECPSSDFTPGNTGKGRVSAAALTDHFLGDTVDEPCELQRRISLLGRS